MRDIRNHWEERYEEPDLPWDCGITPPEVIEFWQSNMAQKLSRSGLVLDIGAGTGTNVAYLAKLGHHAIGVDLSGNGIAIAAERHAGLSLAFCQRITMIHGSAVNLPFDDADFDYILDIGCLHSIPENERCRYADGVVANLRGGGYYHLYGFDRTTSTKELVDYRDKHQTALGRGLGENEVVTLLGPTMRTVSIVQADPNPNPCRWYLFRKL